jgi:hemerythrin-like domain-containing protein
MKSIEYLQSEHDILYGLLDLLEKSTHKLESGRDVPPWMLRENMELIRLYANGTHLNREEAVLSQVNTPDAERDNIEKDHKKYKKMIRFLLRVIEAYDLGYQGARGVYVHYSKNFIDMLRAHLKKEEALWASLASKLKKADSKLVEEFSRIDDSMKRVREKGLSRMETLKKEYRKVAA